MGDVTGFMKYDRQEFVKEPVEKRIKHYKEFAKYLSDEDIKKQAARCMDCGVPFCHWACSVSNLIPEWNDLVYKERWQEAYYRLQATNNLPEITGRICPALCENSCVCSINQPAVTIKNIELMIIEKAFEKGWVKPIPPKSRTNKTVAVVGSGPAGLACADQLNKRGHTVTVFEKSSAVGGLLTFGIPDFKLEKKIVERRVNLLKQEGIIFKTNVYVGKDIGIKKLKSQFDSIVLSGGAEIPRDLVVSGRDLEGVYPAMVYLIQQNQVNRGNKVQVKNRIDAKGKNVIVLGGGDTGSDCVGTANRQGAKSVKQLELLPRSPKEREEDNPWPQWAYVYRKSTSHEEGVEQDYAVMTKSLSGEKGKLKKLHAVRLEFGEKDPQTGRRPMKEVPGSEFELDCDLLVLAMGFLGPEKKGMLKEAGLTLDARGNVETDAYFMTSVEGIFAAGDMRTGQSLVLRAINEGRLAANAAHQWLMNE